MTRPVHDYRDPLEVLLRAEEQTCKGCRFRDVPSNGTKAYCSNPKQHAPLAEQRCEHYEEAA